MSMTTAHRTAMLTLYFNNTDHANIGDAGGLQNSAVAGSFHVSLHETWPGLSGDQTTGETAYGSYARQAVARSGAGWTVSGNNVTNAALITFPAASSGPSTVFYVGIGSASSGAGNLNFTCPMGTNIGPCASDDTAGDNVTIPAHGLSVDDRIAFFADGSELGLPTGITAGTVYFVKTVTDTNNVILSTTSGGSAVNITAVGRGIAFKMIGLVITSAPAITPKIAAGELDLFGY